MKKLLPLILLAVLVATMGASYYTARVDMGVASAVTDTGVAELAFIRTAGAVSGDFILDNGAPNVLSADFGNVQRNSTYFYQDVMNIKNNKPYAVGLSVENITGGAAGLTFDVLVNCPGGAGAGTYALVSGTQFQGTTKVCTLQPGQTANTQFRLATGSSASGGPVNYTITWKGWAVTQ